MDTPRAGGIDDEPVSELETVPISALEHYSYCPRQCGLIHVEQTFDENIYTLRGRRAHERVDEIRHETRPGVRAEYALPLWSRRLGLIGRADLVEFRPEGPYPVEHKVGKKRRWGHDTLQLCAQALCLEEMLGVPVPRGAVYYHGSRARQEVELDAPLRRAVEETTVAVRAMLRDLVMPGPVDDARCPHCSLNDACLPGIVGHPVRERGWQANLFRVTDEGG